MVNTRDFTYISLDLFYRPIQEYIWFRGGDLNHLKVVGWGDPMDSPYISFDVLYSSIQEYIWFRGGDLDRLQVFYQDGGGVTL